VGAIKRSVNELPLDQVIQGDCVQVLNTLPVDSVDLIFADPPYNLQLRSELWRPNRTRVNAVADAWDQFDGFADYDAFSRSWLHACHRVLKDSGTLWVIGTYHNIYRIGAILQDLGYWFLNDIAWVKKNPMPNFHGVRFTNAHETLIWASKYKGARYTFNYQAMKALNDGLQMRSDWYLPICTGVERIKENGKKAHSTQKPEALLYRIILATSHPGDVVLDPFFGTGTTGAVAKKLHRFWIGIEQDVDYVRIARERIEQVKPLDPSVSLEVSSPRRRGVRLPFGMLLESGLLLPGQRLYFRGMRSLAAIVRADGKLEVDGFIGSIHQAAKHLSDGIPGNGWELWWYEEEEDNLQPVDRLRQKLAEQTE